MNLPFSGVAVVFRQRRRAARRGRDLAALAGLLAGQGVLTWVLQAGLFRGRVAHGVQGVLQQSLAPWAVAATLLLMAVAAVMGASAAPPRQSEEEIQAALLAHLIPFDLCTGRLLAALAVPLASLAASCLFWIGAQLLYHIIYEGGVGGVLAAHLVLLCAVFMMGTAGLLGALRSRPGRAWGRGAITAMLLAGACVGAPFVLNARVLTMDDPARLIQGYLLVNPVAAVEAALHRDILRAGWVYDHVAAADYAFDPPAPLATAGIYFLVAVLAHALATVRLRKAMQNGT